MTGLGARAGALLFSAFLSFSGVPSTPGALAVESVVRSGHFGTILDVVRDDERGVLISAGADGTLRVWNNNSHALLRRLSVTRQTVRQIALSPSAPLVAAIVTDGARSWELSVWNWETGVRLYAFTLTSEPLFARFSQSGSFLLCGLMSSDSLRLLAAKDGSPVPFSPPMLGMVGFAEVSRTDRTLMTYELSGRIRYWDLSAGTTLLDLPARAGLRDISMTRNRRVIVGHAGDVVTGIDALSGADRFTFSSPALGSLDGDRVACLSAAGSLRIRAIGKDSATFQSGVDGTYPGASRVRLTGDGVLMAGAGLEEVSASGSAIAFPGGEIQELSDIALTPSALALASSRIITLFPMGGTLAHVAPVTLSNPYAAAVMLRPTESGSILVWPREAPVTGIAEIDPAGGTIRDLGVRFSSPLIDVAVRDGRVSTLERNGEIRIIQAADGNVLFSASRPGTTSIAVMDDASLIVGRGPGGGIAGSLVRIDTRTAETVVLASPNIYTGRLIADPDRGLLYSLGVDEQGRTNLVRHSGADLETDTVIDSTQGDHPSASLSLDPRDGFLYSTLGSGSIEVWDGGAKSAVSNPDFGAISLVSYAGVTASLDRDSLVSLWNAVDRRQLFQIALFPDGGWAAVMPDGSFAGSETGRQHIAVVLIPPPSSR